MGNLRKALICGYYDENRNYIVEISVEKIKKVIEEHYPEYKNFETNLEQKIKLYDALKLEFGNSSDLNYEQFVVEMIGG